MAEKLFITAGSLQLDSCRLAKKIYDSGFRPNFIIALWRGGTPVGCYVQEFLKSKGVKTDHIATRTSRYTGIEQADENVRIHGLDYVIKKANNTDRLLIVDDVFDSGKTIHALVEKLKSKARANTPSEIKIATVYYKPQNNRTGIMPDFYLHETDKWLVFPHELEGLSNEEIREGKGKEIAELLKCLEHAQAVLEGKLEAPLDDVKDEIRIIEEILRHKGPCYFRCCNEMETRDGIIYIHCDSSPELPLNKFQAYCANCFEEIGRELPELKKRYNFLKKKKR